MSVLLASELLRSSRYIRVTLSELLRASRSIRVAPTESLQPSDSIRVTLSESHPSESLHPRRSIRVLFPSPLTVNQSLPFRVALSESLYPSRSIRVVSERRAHRTSTMTHDERAGSTAGGAAFCVNITYRHVGAGAFCVPPLICLASCVMKDTELDKLWNCLQFYGLHHALGTGAFCVLPLICLARPR